MSDAPATPNSGLAERFATLVTMIVERPSAALEHREAAKAIVAAAKGGGVVLTLADDGLRGDGETLDAPLLAARFAAYGIEELEVTPRVALADLLDLARLLAAEPGPDDPSSRFAGRAAAIDAKALPRRLRPRLAPAEPSSTAAQVAEPAATTSRKTPTGTARATPTGTPRATPTGTPRATPTSPLAPLPDVAVDREAPERLAVTLAVPESGDPKVAAAIASLRAATDIEALRAALEQVVILCDLAFRTGNDDGLIDGLTALAAVEHEALENDSADERRQAFNHAIRRLARPVLLRQVAVLRHRRGADPVASGRLQQVLYRFGTDGAEAVVDEYLSASTPEARAICLETLRGLRRTYDALLALSRDTRDLVVRQAAAILGELRDERGEAILVELLRHPDARSRRAAVAALGMFESESATEAIGLALQDESPIVRLRAVAALTGRRTPRTLDLLLPLLEGEGDREVHYAAIAAVGSVASPEATQLLIRIAQGEGAHPLRRSAGVRLQACVALVAIRTPVAMAAVQGLRDDRDREVREAAVRLVAQAQRRTLTSGIPAVSAP